jgi:DHA2 family multidrug resistance protein
MDPGEARRLDLRGLVLMAAALAALEIALKEAPGRGWASPLVLALLALSLGSGAVCSWSCAQTANPVICLRTFRHRDFTIGCLFSFVLGVGLFGSVYLMPVFLAFVRGHGALQIGQIMLVTGVAQLVTAPVAVALERRLGPHVLTGFGFVLFAAGLAMSGFQTGDTDFRQMFWPQVLRGAAVMFCLLPPTRLALGGLAAEEVPGASGLFNLMRNLGGAIGIALVDTVIYGRGPVLGRLIARRLRAGDVATAKAVGIPLDMFQSQGNAPVDADTQAMLRPMVDHLALVWAINEAWLLMAVMTALALLALPFTAAAVAARRPGRVRPPAGLARVGDAARPPGGPFRR